MRKSIKDSDPQSTQLTQGKFWAQRRRVTHSRSLGKSLAELGLSSTSSMLHQVPRTAVGAWPRGGTLSFQVHNVLFLAPELKQLINEGPVLRPICPWPAVRPWADDFASLSLSFPFHCKMGLLRPTPPAEKTQREDVGAVPGAVPGPRWVAQDSGCECFFFCPSLQYTSRVSRKTVPWPLGFRAWFLLGSYKAAPC